MPPSFLKKDAWMTSQLNVTLVCKLRGSLVCLTYFVWHVIHGCLYSQALAGIRSTGARITCLYCRTFNSFIYNFCHFETKRCHWLLAVSHNCPGLNPIRGMWESCQWLGDRQWLPPGTPVSSARHKYLPSEWLSRTMTEKVTKISKSTTCTKRDFTVSFLELDFRLLSVFAILRQIYRN